VAEPFDWAPLAVRAVDAIVVLLVAEFLGLLLWSRRRRRMLDRLGLAGNLAAGGCLLLALRSVLAGAAWPWLPLSLAAAFACHLLDLSRRLR